MEVVTIMANFEIKTHSTFENVYYVEADNLEEAINIVKSNGADVPDFMQIHLWEDITDMKQLVETVTYSEWHESKNNFGYF